MNKNHLLKSTLIICSFWTLIACNKSKDEKSLKGKNVESSLDCSNDVKNYNDGYDWGAVVNYKGECVETLNSLSRSMGWSSLTKNSPCVCEGYNDGKNGKKKRYGN